MVKHLLFSFLIFYAGICLGQQGNLAIKGSIYTIENQNNDIDISLITSKDSIVVKSVISDQKGFFELTHLKAGVYLLFIKKLGYQSIFYGPIEVSSSVATVEIPQLQIIKKIQELNAVTVKASTPIIEKRNGKTIINVENSVFGIGSTGLEILQTAPGVSIDNEQHISLNGKRGVTLYIDGKASNLTGNDLIEYLKNIPTNNIAQIELMFTPSAKYDAIGNGGVINIKFKKGKNLGTSFTYSGGAGLGKNYRYNSGLNINSRGKKTNFFGNFDYARIKAIDNNFLNRNIKSNDSLFIINNDDLKDRNNYSLNLGLDYYLSKNHTIGFLINSAKNNFSSDEANNTQIFRQQSLYSEILSSSFEDRSIKNTNLNLNYAGVLNKNGATLSVDFDFLNYDRNSEEDFSSDYHGTQLSAIAKPLELSNNSPSAIKLFSFKTDYTAVLKNNWFLDAGLKSSFANSESERNINLIQGLNPFGNLISTFNYKENINAAYFIFRRKQDKSNLELQLRAEHTLAKGTSEDPTVHIDKNYLSFFPVFLYSRDVLKDDKISFSYNRRLNRPNYQDLNPFFYFLDQYTYNKGNINLKPSYANSFEINYLIKEKYSFSLRYNHVKDFTYTTYQQDDASGIAITSKSNFDYRKSYGMDIYLPYDIVKWWKANLSVEAYYEFFKFNSAFSGTIYNSSFSSTTNLFNMFSFGKGYTSQLNFHYETPTAYGIYNFKSAYYTNIGFAKSVLSGAGSLRFLFMDVFDTNSNRYSTYSYNLDLQAKEKRETRNFRLSFSYKFGKSTIKATRNRKLGIDAEKSRIGE
ncbi:MAG: TonB-dependent receptor [Candidatus Dojkabacteria bacterium]